MHFITLISEIFIDLKAQQNSKNMTIKGIDPKQDFRNRKWKRGKAIELT